MNIKVVSEKTGLTKKAIKYYESEGLINPLKNKENNYRVYTEDDIIKLNLIGSLRTIEIPISEIKRLLDGDKNVQEVMKDTLNKVNETINNLEKTRLVISSIIDKESKDFYNISDVVKRLRETLELSVMEKKEYISQTLLRIFPGNFGEYFVSCYDPFLNIVIDNNEKKDLWIKMVEALDDIEELEENHPFIAGMNKIDISKIEGSSKFDFNKFINEEINVKEKYKNYIISFVKTVNENEELKKSISKSLSISENIFDGMGGFESKFDLYLEELNEDYKRYRDIGKKISNEASDEIKQEFGFTLDEFMKTLLKAKQD